MEQTKKSIQEMSIDTRLILQRLEKARVDETITYAELDGLIGRDVRKVAAHCLQSALRAAMRREIVFGTVWGVGLKRLGDGELAGVGEVARQKIRRTAKRAIKKMLLVQDFDSLSNEEKVRHNASLSMLGAVAHIASTGQAKTLERRVSSTMGALPLQRTLEAFMGEKD